MSNYKSSEQKHSILNALEKRRREQEAARRAPELRQMAQQQRKQLADLQQKAEMLERTVASFQVPYCVIPQWCVAVQERTRSHILKQRLCAACRLLQ